MTTDNEIIKSIMIGKYNHFCEDGKPLYTSFEAVREAIHLARADQKAKDLEEVYIYSDIVYGEIRGKPPNAKLRKGYTDRDLMLATRILEQLKAKLKED